MPKARSNTRECSRLPVFSRVPDAHSRPCNFWLVSSENVSVWGARPSPPKPSGAPPRPTTACRDEHTRSQFTEVAGQKLYIPLQPAGQQSSFPRAVHCTDANYLLNHAFFGTIAASKPKTRREDSPRKLNAYLAIQ